MTVLSDPRIFNFILIAIYAANIVRWGYAGSFADAMYWSGALWITLAVTFGYQR